MVGNANDLVFKVAEMRTRQREEAVLPRSPTESRSSASLLIQLTAEQHVHRAVASYTSTTVVGRKCRPDCKKSTSARERCREIRNHLLTNRQ
jgi:hypothetical protein